MRNQAPTGAWDARAELAPDLEKIVVLSPVAFSFAGENLIDARGWRAPMGGESDPLVGAIQATLYDRCYTRRRGALAATSVDPEFARCLAITDVRHETWDLGWTIQQFGANGQAFVRKGDRERVAMPGAYIFEGAAGLAAQVGARVSLRAMRESFEVQPGYYFRFGDTLDELADQLSLVRLYFHCHANSAGPLLRMLSIGLNRFEIPFQMKTPSAAALYGRADALVLYIGVRYFPIVARVVAEIREDATLEAATPLFTKVLWPGVGAAVEPGSGESFGTHRCRLTAEGIVDAWRVGEQSAKARIEAISKRFAAVGLDLTRPWVGPSGYDPFERPREVRLK